MEIERKFLVTNLDFLKEKECTNCEIFQGYLFNKNDTQLRVRYSKADRYLPKGYITAKSKTSGNGLVREEYEMEVTPEIAKELLKECNKSQVIHKIRHTFEEWYNNDEDFYKIEVDEFLELNAGLVIAEIEFKTEKESHQFDPKLFPYLGEEVTSDYKYKNDYISKTPFVLW